jgi:hypothetical protein
MTEQGRSLAMQLQLVERARPVLDARRQPRIPQLPGAER